MATRARSLEERVADLEREVAALKGAARPVERATGFAEEGQPALLNDAGQGADLERRVLELEIAVAQLKSAGAAPGPKDWLARVGWAENDPVYDEAMRLGTAWRRRENLKSIRELERRGEIDADPGHRSSQHPGPRRKAGKGTRGKT